MLKPELFMILPDYVCTPDGMEIDRDGDLILSCPNFAQNDLKGCMVRIDKERKVSKWFDVPVHPETGIARNMGIAFDKDGYLYVCDNQGWSGDANLSFKGRVLKIKADKEGRIESCAVVAKNMEHPNGIRIKGDYMYLTQSLLTKVKDPSGKLVSCVYRFGLDETDIAITNTLDDPHILTTFITQNSDCQYGADGIVFDKQGNLYVGNFGDGAIHRITFAADGSAAENAVFAKDASQLKSTDGMIMDDDGNIYVADFSDNAIAKVHPDGTVERIAQSPDCDGLDGGLDQPGEPILWQGVLVASCFDLVTDAGKVNTKHEMPATMAMLRLN
ncbi:MAG: SMP-30/gluconolactonase/LRE family protein [Propionivibrio sp.]|jgi:sugar lactone lactonase YvrE|nr:SMP-30/gluconolactonase/LRE family protein [Propionivibrio sp.]MBP7523184.1 SMP-30/gluconolactonase/LRE family protein [Propionivibrio sp.]